MSEKMHLQFIKLWIGIVKICNMGGKLVTYSYLMRQKAVKSDGIGHW